MNSTNINIQVVYFDGFLKENQPMKLYKWQPSESISFHNFDLQDDYFFIVSTEKIAISRLVDDLKELLNGSYLLIEIYSYQNLSLFMGVKSQWLQSQLNTESEIWQPIVSKILENWQRGNISSMAIKHDLFVKNFRDSNYKSILALSYFFELMYRLLDDFDKQTRKGLVDKFKDTERQRIVEIEAKVTENFYFTTPTIEEMATATGMSSSKFKILFKEIFGQSPHQYILDKKLLYANELLQTGQYSLTQIAYKLGYHHTSGFTRIYKKKYREQ